MRPAPSTQFITSREEIDEEYQKRLRQQMKRDKVVSRQASKDTSKYDTGTVTHLGAGGGVDSQFLLVPPTKPAGAA